MHESRHFPKPSSKTHFQNAAELFSKEISRALSENICVGLFLNTWPLYSGSAIYKLQHFTIHCNALQHTATHCNTLQHMASLFRERYIHMITHYNTL